MKLVEIIRGIARDEPAFHAVQPLAHASQFPVYWRNRPDYPRSRISSTGAMASIEAIVIGATQIWMWLIPLRA